MPHTITALYESVTNAQAAIATLATVGIPRAAITLTKAGSIDTMGGTGAHAFAALPRSIDAALEQASLSEVDRAHYEGALRRGSVMLLLALEEVEIPRVLNILRDHGSVDLEARHESWRREGWGSTSPVATEGWGGYSATSTGGKSVSAHPERSANDGKAL